MEKELIEKLNKILVNAGDLSFRRRVMEVVEAFDVKGNEKVLDCGCGDGFYIMVLRELYPSLEITGIDYDEKILDKAKKYIKQDGITKLIKSEVYDLPFKDNYFDKIILSEVLEHLENENSGLKEIYRVLKKNGRLIITVPNHNYPFWWDPLNRVREKFGLGHFNKDNELLAGLWSMHLRLYYPDEVMRLIKKTGFKVLKTKLLTHYCFPFSQIILHLGKRLLLWKRNSDAITENMEKFNWQKTKDQDFNVIRLGQWLLEKIDWLNENREFSLTTSSHGILLICGK